VSLVLLDTGLGVNRARASLSSLDVRGERVHVDVIDARAGRASACNTAAAGSDSEFVAFVPGYVSLDSRWLREAVDAADRHGASAVATRIVGGEACGQSYGVTLSGHPVATTEEPAIETRVLYASDCPGFFRRRPFLDAGGFDEDLLDYFHDVDVGWRLNLRGHDVVFAPAAVAWDPEPAVIPRWTRVRRRRLAERSALAMVYTNYEAARLERILPPAIALCLLRGLICSGIDALPQMVSETPSDRVAVSPELVAHLLALEDFHRRLPALRAKRARVQRGRLRSDAELAHLFSTELVPPGASRLLADVARVLATDFAVRDCDEQPAATVSNAGHDGAGARTAHRSIDPDSPLPTVSIVILTALGPTHLEPCLSSLREQAYPRHLVEVIVVDNASRVDPTPEAERLYPGVRVIRNATNLGFAGGNNVGAEAATGEWLVFLNDDTRVAADWLRELIETVRQHGASAASSCVLDWSGRQIDFVEGAMNFQGKGFQLHYGAPSNSLVPAERQMLFPCGCAMLVHRRAFMDAGEWDAATFAYYEDVELGWRLTLLGHTVWFAPRSIVYHRHHGTTGGWPDPSRNRLYERNSLRLIYQLLDSRSLRRVLPAALLLSADRALLSSALSREAEFFTLGHPRTPRECLVFIKRALRMRGIGRQTRPLKGLRQLGVRGAVAVIRDSVWPRRMSGTAGQRRNLYVTETMSAAADDAGSTESLPIETAAILSGVYSFLADLPAVAKRRAEIQRRRTLSDSEILTRFGSHWTHPVAARFQREHDELLKVVVEEFALNDLAASSPVSLLAD
jgi:GT2 family glycosyltransferase